MFLVSIEAAAGFTAVMATSDQFANQGAGTVFGIPGLFMRFHPRLLRQALRHYNYDRFDHARHCFQETLKNHPAHVPSLYFLAEIHGARFDFDNAFRYCRLLARSEPEMAESLQSDLWLLKRLGARMHSKS